MFDLRETLRFRGTAVEHRHIVTSDDCVLDQGTADEVRSTDHQ
jgi:hypothetical protein